MLKELKMTSERIEELQNRTAYPESNSVYQALLQVWNEMQQEFNNRTCENCQHYVESKTSQQFGHCLRKSDKPTVYNTVENDWYCKGIEDEA